LTVAFFFQSGNIGNVNSSVASSARDVIQARQGVSAATIEDKPFAPRQTALPGQA